MHANPALAGVFVISTGVIGAMLGPTLLDAINVRLPFARGLSFGTISHGIGTSQAVLKGELAGAVSGVAMGLGAIIYRLLGALDRAGSGALTRRPNSNRSVGQHRATRTCRQH